MSTLLNWDRLDALMDDRGVDAVVAVRPGDVLYCTGMYSLSHWLIRGVQSYAVVPREQGLGTRLVVTIADADLAAEQHPDVGRFVPYGTFFVEAPAPDIDPSRLEEADERLAVLAAMKPYATAQEALIAALSDLPSSARRIAIDDAAMPYAVRNELERLLPDRELVPVDDLLITTRMVKTAEERRRLERAAHITENAILEVIGQLREGMTELEAKLIFETSLLEQGAQPKLTVIGFGEHSAYPNATPGDRPLRGGDIVRFDVGCTYEHYWADLSRCAVWGSPSQRIQDYYRALVMGEDAAIEAVRPGRRASEVFHDTMKVVRDSGIPQYRRQHVGHGIGVDIYDPPILNASTDTVLEPGMLLNVETPFYELGFGGLQIEDLVIVTEVGAEVLTRSPRRLFVVEEGSAADLMLGD